jgi:hypothetical protein
MDFYVFLLNVSNALFAISFLSESTIVLRSLSVFSNIVYLYWAYNVLDLCNFQTALSWNILYIIINVYKVIYLLRDQYSANINKIDHYEEYETLP